MALNFPSNPTLNQIYTSPAGTSWRWNGQAWVSYNTAAISQIVSGSVVARVDTDPNQIFLIKSGSTTYHQVASNGDTSIYSDLFIIKNNTTQQPVLTVSQSIVQFATQSLSPSGTAPNGAFWFTSTDAYLGLD